IPLGQSRNPHRRVHREVQILIGTFSNASVERQNESVFPQRILARSLSIENTLLNLHNFQGRIEIDHFVLISKLGLKIDRLISQVPSKPHPSFEPHTIKTSIQIGLAT